MLYPAQIYKDELQRLLTSKWYEPKYQWYFGGSRFPANIPDNADWRQDFVHLDKDGKVDGYFSYQYNEAAQSLSNFGLVSFADDGTALVLDAIHRIRQLFKEGLRRLDFWAFADNPANKLYNSLIKRYGGHKAGYQHDVAFFGGLYHDVICYEIQRNERITHGL